MEMVSEMTKYLIIIICILTSPLNNENGKEILIDAISLHDGEIESLICYMKNNDDTVYCYPSQLKPEDVIFKISPIGTKNERYLFEIVDQEEEVINLVKSIKDFNLMNIKAKSKEQTLQLSNGSLLYLLYRGKMVYLFSEELDDIVFAVHE